MLKVGADVRNLPRGTGPTFFAVDNQCNRVYWHLSDDEVDRNFLLNSTAQPGGWQMYNDVNWELQRNIHCYVESGPFKWKYVLYGKGSVTPERRTKFEYVSRSEVCLFSGTFFWCKMFCF